VRRRPAVLLCALLGALALALCLGAGTASAKLIWQPQYSFGNDGTPATSFGFASGVAVQQAEQKLYVYDPNVQKIYKFNRLGAGEYTPAGGAWPITVATGFGDPDIDVDDTSGTSKGNVYYSPDGEAIRGYSSAGAELPEFEPEGGEKCGISVAGDGHVWTGNYGSGGKIEEFPPTGGAPLRALSASVGNPCAVEVDTSKHYLFAAMYGGSV
jgi:sugar lactone lactonase YvrE